MQKGKMFLFYENTQEEKSNLILILECKEVYCLYRGAPWVRKFENVTVKKTFAGTAQTTWNRFKLRYFDWPIPVFVRWWRHLIKTGTGIGQSKYLNLTLFHVVWSVPAKVLLTVTFSILSILTGHDLFGSDVEQDCSYTVFVVVFYLN